MKKIVYNYILICFSLYRLFPARTPMVKTPDYWNLEHHVGNVVPGLARSALSQGAYQIAALGTTLAFAIFGGLITGKCNGRCVLCSVNYYQHLFTF